MEDKMEGESPAGDQEAFTSVSSKKSRKRKAQEEGRPMETGEQPSKRPDFPQISRDKLLVSVMWILPCLYLLRGRALPLVLRRWRLALLPRGHCGGLVWLLRVRIRPRRTPVTALDACARPDRELMHSERRSADFLVPASWSPPRLLLIGCFAGVTRIVLETI